jgi:D-proline reductase (dithiol) PrdB
LTNISRLKNKIIAKAITRFPSFSKRFTEAYKVYETHGEIPWAPLEKELRDCKLALVSTCGVHHIDQEPFDMNDPNGDPSFRAIDLTKPLRDLIITHDYYDHSDADKDINIVFPVERLKEFETEGLIGKLSSTHFGFMGHIAGAYIITLINESAPAVANRLKADDVDVVLLTPA